MREKLDILFKSRFKPEQVRWFKRFLYLYLLVCSCYWLAQADVLFGEHSYIYKSATPSQGYSSLAFILYEHQQLALPMLWIILLYSLVALSGWNHFTADIVLWLMTVNVHFSLYTGLTSGDYLLNVFLFYNIFLQNRETGHNIILRELLHFVHNCAVMAVMIHLCLMYLVAGYVKLVDPSWQAGLAIYQTGLIDHYRVTWHNLFNRDGLMAKILNYVVMIYQLLFPVLVWIRPIKKYFLVIGLLMHLYIIVFMGLFGFGIVMMGGYILFWPIARD